MTNDSREAAMRYRLRKEAIERGEEPPDDDDRDRRPASGAKRSAPRSSRSRSSRPSAVGTSTTFPGPASRSRASGTSTDPDWWIRRKIERERLTGLGPPALTLRTEYASLGRPARRAAHRGRGARVPLRLQSPRDRGTSAAARRPAGGHADRRDRRVGARLEGTSGCRRPPHRGACGDADQTTAELAFLAGRSLTRAAGLELGVQLALQSRDIHLSTQIGGRQHRGGAPGGDRRAEGRRQIAPLGEPQHQRTEE